MKGIFFRTKQALRPTNAFCAGIKRIQRFCPDLQETLPSVAFQRIKA